MTLPTNVFLTMFEEKERKWITGSEYYVNVNTWKDFVLNTPFKMWLSFKPFVWNIREPNEIQILYMKTEGPIRIYEVRIIVKEEEEPIIREWLSCQEWMHM